MTFKNAKTILFTSLIAAMILPFSGMELAEAKMDNKSKNNDKLKKDLDLLTEAENIEKKYKNLKYDKEGKNKNGAVGENQKRHQDIVKELNDRGIFHKSQPKPVPYTMDEYKTDSIGETTVKDNSIETPMISSIESNIETMDSVCCGGSHDKKLEVRAGMEWPNSNFPWWTHYSYGPWSAFSSTFGASTAQITGNESDVEMFFQTKSNHAVTWATFSVTSDVMIKDQWGNWIELEDGSKSYTGVYYATQVTVHADDILTVDTLPGPSRNVISMSISSIS